MKNVKIVTVGSNTYLGTLTFDDNAITLANSMPVASPDVTINDCAEYIKAENAGKLSNDITIRGTAAVFSERDFSDDLKDEITILQAKFAKAEKTALPNLVNANFDRLR